MNPTQKQQLDLSLPEAPRRRSPGAAGWLAVLLGVGNLAFLVLLAVSLRGSKAPADGAPTSPETLEKLARTLERRTLYEQAAAVWREYARAAELTQEEAARVTYLRGKNLHLAGKYAEAARFFSEYEDLDVSREDRRRAARLLSDCLSALGKEEVRESVLKAYTIPGHTEEGTVVARVGGDGITLEELRDSLARQTASMLRLEGVTLGPDELRVRAQEMAREQLKNRETLERVLQQAIQSEVLYREALAEKYATDERTVEDLAEIRRGYLADRLLRDRVQEAMKAIGPTDLRNHYEAHKETYVDKPSVEFSFQKFPGEVTARSALENLDAARFTKGSGRAASGEPIPGIGRSAEATAHLMALDEGQAGNRPLRIGESWYVFRSDAKHRRRQKPFEEAEAEVRADLARRKRRESIEELQQILTQKYRVEILDEELAGALEGDATGNDEKNEGAPGDGTPDGGGGHRDDGKS